MNKEKQLLAAIGENMVVRLLQMGIDAINANNIHTNYARVAANLRLFPGFRACAMSWHKQVLALQQQMI